MDRKNRLALVKRVLEQDTVNVACRSCGGSVVEQPQGTAYCCDAAELAHLRKLVLELDQRLAVELEDPPLDAHATRFLAYLRGKVHKVHHVKADV